jgi:hypothetical protein
MKFLKLILKIIIAFFIIFCCNKNFAQEKGSLDFSIARPTMYGNFFNSTNKKIFSTKGLSGFSGELEKILLSKVGIINLGINYNCKKLKKFYLSGSVNTDFYTTYSRSSCSIIYGGLSEPIYYINNVKFRINLSYPVKLYKIFYIVPKIGIGYLFMNINYGSYVEEHNYFMDVIPGGYFESPYCWYLYQGINSNIELKLNISTNHEIGFFVFGNYDYTYLLGNKLTRLLYYRQIYISNFGIGINISNFDIDIKQILNFF